MLADAAGLATVDKAEVEVARLDVVADARVLRATAEVVVGTMSDVVARVALPVTAPVLLIEATPVPFVGVTTALERRPVPQGMLTIAPVLSGCVAFVGGV